MTSGLKIKCVRRDNFAIAGFEPSTVRGAIGRLLLAARKDGSLVYVGPRRQSSEMLRELLEQIPTKTPAVKLGRKNAVFTRPMLATDIEYRAWTEVGKLRHPSFNGLSEDADLSSVYALSATLTEARVSAIS
ncbi:ATP-dependent carboligase [Rhizobium herbae]|uniref:DNA ligase (ATP) n=1 Tax=Rhizobium herbae TaxID=508661 RepID=A0ABS7HD66_9HYPH|nr:ATP-dependent carboligase [Rhizobium herbae]